MYTGCWQCRVRYWLSDPLLAHDGAIKWKHFPRNWSFVREIHRSPMDSPHRGQWRGALVFFYLRLNKRLSKQFRRRWFETPLRSLWRHCNALWHVYREFAGYQIYIGRRIRIPSKQRKYGQDERMISVALVTDTRFKPCIYIYIYIYIQNLKFLKHRAHRHSLACYTCSKIAWNWHLNSPKSAINADINSASLNKCFAINVIWYLSHVMYNTNKEVGLNEIYVKMTLWGESRINICKSSPLFSQKNSVCQGLIRSFFSTEICCFCVPIEPLNFLESKGIICTGNIDSHSLLASLRDGPARSCLNPR